MKQAEKKFRYYAVAAVFVLVTVLMGILNAVNFTMAARDADRVTEMIAGKKDFFPGGPEEFRLPEGSKTEQPGAFGPMGPMGPDSPDLSNSLRFFTCSFEKDGTASLDEYRISAVSEDEAVEWARTLLSGKTGWSRGTYRYRVYKQNGLLCVTVVDQGREMISAYRTLIFSLCGIIAVTLLSWVFLKIVGKKLFAPIERADRKQKQFIEKAEKEFKMPLTVISAQTELLQRENGPDERTDSIRRQVRKMDLLVRKLGTLTIFDENDIEKTRFSLSDLMKETLEDSRERYDQQNITPELAIDEGISLTGGEESFRKLISELSENALKYAVGRAEFSLTEKNGRIRLSAKNPANLPDGPIQQVFDRFTTLQNAEEGSTGLGLAYVRDIVTAHNGRVSAEVRDGQFILTIDL